LDPFYFHINQFYLSMKSLFLSLLVVGLSVSGLVAQQTQPAVIDTSIDEKTRLAAENPVGLYGNAFSVNEALSVEEVLARASELEGQRVQVKAMIKESCPMRGCWVNVEQAGAEIKVKVQDGFIVFPKSSVGHTGVFEGVVEKIEMNLEQTKKHLAHLAEERGEAFDPETVTEAMSYWR
ncbi:DUF4920 domain-containing protein, partial [Arthrospira platensis SPKY1]|nr:DUF4920 domain-containing protein [Arthrospira platensis SPKY1]